MSVLNKIFTEQQKMWMWLETADGIEIDFDCGAGTRMIGAAGLGATPIENVTIANGFRNGVQFIGQRKGERYIPLQLLRKDCGCFGVCGDEISHLVPGCSCCGGAVHAMRYIHEFFKMRCDDFGNPVGAKLWVQHCHNDERRFACVFPSILPGFSVDYSRPQPDCYRTEIELMSPSPYFYGEEVCAESTLTIPAGGGSATSNGTLEICTEAPVRPTIIFDITGATDNVPSIVFGNPDTGANIVINTESFGFYEPGAPPRPLVERVRVTGFDPCLNRFEYRVQVYDFLNEEYGESQLDMLSFFEPPNALQSFVVGNEPFNFQTFVDGPGNGTPLTIKTTICASPAFCTA